MSDRGRVLLVGGSDSPGPNLPHTLQQRGFAVFRASSGAEAVELVGSQRPDVVLAGPSLGPAAALDLTRRICTDRPDLPVVLVSPGESTELLDTATRAGAFSVLLGPIDEQSVVFALDRALEHRALYREVQRLEMAVRRSERFGELLGESAAMRALYDLLDRAADSEVPVLITGESGTGKEVAARALHRRGARSAQPFVAVNVAAVPDGLLESELFGHEKGAFTDARATRRGLFAQADGGTLFLDEIGELSLAMQPKLLRALQERRVRPVGSDREHPFDARIIAATNRHVESMVSAGTFREDLYYRLAVIHFELPPLRERGSDVLLLAHHILLRVTARTGKRVKGISHAAARQLLSYRWPGNVRELENVIERAVALTRATEIGPGDLPLRIQGSRPDPLSSSEEDPGELVTMEVVEERYIRRVMAAVGANKARAARILGFDRKTLYRKLDRYGIDAAPEPQPPTPGRQ